MKLYTIENPYKSLLGTDEISFTDGSLPAAMSYLKKTKNSCLEKLVFVISQIREFDKIVFAGQKVSTKIYLHFSEEFDKRGITFIYSSPVPRQRGNEYYIIKIQQFVSSTINCDFYYLIYYVAQLIRLKVRANFPTTALLTCYKLKRIKAEAEINPNQEFNSLFNNIAKAAIIEAGQCYNSSGQDMIFVAHLAANFYSFSGTADKKSRDEKLRQILTLDAAHYLPR